MAEVTDDDFPETSWLEVRVLDGDTPKAVRMRAALKCLLRSYGIRCVRVSGQVPAVERDAAAASRTLPTGPRPPGPAR